MPTPNPAARRGGTGAVQRATRISVAVLLLAGLCVSLAAAQRPSSALFLSPDAAARGGMAIAISRHALGGARLVAADLSSTTAGRLLAVNRAGSMLAVADQLGGRSGTLILARDDGAQLRVQLPGILSAGFSPDGAQVAVIDGTGAAWRVDTSSGAATPLAAGPFVGPPQVLADGSLRLLAVSSLEAPIGSTAVVLDPASGKVTALSDESLVYAILPTADGLVLVAHRPGGTLLRRTWQAGAVVADLGPGAIGVSLSPDGGVIAFERHGRVFVMDGPSAPPAFIGEGRQPQVAADGRSVLVSRGTTSVLVDLRGETLLELAGDAAAFVACDAGCE